VAGSKCLRAWGLEHKTLGQIDAIGVDEIQYSKGHRYLTLVYQIDLGVTRLLWVGKENQPTISSDASDQQSQAPGENQRRRPDHIQIDPGLP